MHSIADFSILSRRKCMQHQCGNDHHIEWDPLFAWYVATLSLDFSNPCDGCLVHHCWLELLFMFPLLLLLADWSYDRGCLLARCSQRSMVIALLASRLIFEITSARGFSHGPTHLHSNLHSHTRSHAFTHVCIMLGRMHVDTHMHMCMYAWMPSVFACLHMCVRACVGVSHLHILQTSQ